MRSFAAVLMAALLLSPPPAEADAPANTWVKLAEEKPAGPAGAVLVPVPQLKKMLYFGGELPGTGAYMQAFDPAGRKWSEFSAAKSPAKRGIHPYYQAACDPKAKKLYAFSEGNMYSFDLEAGAWTSHEPAAALDGLSWHTAAIDPEARKLVVVGADKRPENLGWSRTAILDLDSGKWSELAAPQEAVVKGHKQLVAAAQAIMGLVGRIRLAWYRDPKGAGTEAELNRLRRRCEALTEMPATAEFAAEVRKVAELLAERKTLQALKAARALQRKIEELAERQYPVPASRRNSPLVFDAGNKLFVLFGGDREDCLTNDTWVLDLAKQSWRRARPAAAPSPRAGHALVCLPASGRIALYGGYIQSNDNWYGTQPWKSVEPRQLWLYDAKADRWDLLGAWRSKRGDTSIPPVAAEFYGYCRQYCSPPALADDGQGSLVLAVPAGTRHKGSTWMLKVDAASLEAAGEKLAGPPDQRLYRTERFLAAYCEVPDLPKDTHLDKLPANRWVKLPDPPRNVAYGCRQRDWGTAVWDSDNDQIVMWGGGHCVRSASCPLHYSPLSGRMVEGYDADEPYSANGGGGFGSSLGGRPWVDGHAYNTYAYDPKAGLVVTGSGFLYDTVAMDWLRGGPMPRPFQYSWHDTVTETTPHGAVVWARAAKGDSVSLWLFDRQKGWSDLKPQGKLYLPYCDSEGMTYDSKRDRMLLGWGGGYMKAGDGTITAFDFATRNLEKITPANAELGRIHNTREMVYLDHADWVVFAEPLVQGDPKTAKPYLRIYDCEKNRYFLLDAGRGPEASVHSQGWCHDAKRKLIYVITYRGNFWALKLDPHSAELLDTPADAAQQRND